MSGDPQGFTKLAFAGTDGEECEEFVLAVRRIAIQNDRLADPGWVARAVFGCFVKDALRWHATLPAEVKGDWMRLEKALMEKYPACRVDSSTGASMPHWRHSCPSRRIGRIRVIVDSRKEFNGYVSNQFPRGEFVKTASIEEAVQVDLLDYSQRGVEFQVRGVAENVKLGVACDSEPSSFLKHDWWGTMVCITGKKCAYPSKTIFTTDTWRLLADDTIEPFWKMFSPAPFRLYARIQGKVMTVFIRAHNDKVPMWDDYPARLCFEEI